MKAWLPKLNRKQISLQVGEPFGGGRLRCTYSRGLGIGVAKGATVVASGTGSGRMNQVLLVLGI